MPYVEGTPCIPLTLEHAAAACSMRAQESLGAATTTLGEEEVREPDAGACLWQGENSLLAEAFRWLQEGAVFIGEGVTRTGGKYHRSVWCLLARKAGYKGGLGGPG